MEAILQYDHALRGTDKMHLSVVSSSNVHRNICRRKGMAPFRTAVMDQSSITSTGSLRGKKFQEIFGAQGREIVSVRRLVGWRFLEDGRG
jgi:hypothetical protein